jgi:hypothetical protein
MWKLTYVAFMIKKQFLICTATYHSMCYDDYKFTLLAPFQNSVTAEVKLTPFRDDIYKCRSVYVFNIDLYLTTHTDDKLIWRQLENSKHYVPKKIWNKALLQEIADSFGYNLVI